MFSGIFINPKIGVSGIINGGIALSCTETGSFSKTAEIPQVNSFIPSGRFITWYSSRFDEHYGGGAS